MKMIDIPQGWTRGSLDALCLPDAPIMYGILQPGPEIVDGIPYVRPTEIDDNGIRLNEIKRTSLEIATQYQRSTLRTGDLLITIVGTLGKVAEVPPQLNGANITQSSARIRVNPKVASTKYVKHFLRSSPLAIQQYDWHRLGTGVPRLNLHHVRDLQVPLPSLSEQKRIAEILDKADCIRRERRNALLQLDELVHSLFMTTVGPAARGYSRWAPKRIEQLAARRNGAMRTGPFGSDLKHSEFVDEGVAVLGIDNAVQNRFAWAQRRFITEDKYEKLKRYRVYPGDVIITIMGTVGRSAVVPNSIPLAINTKHLACITLDRDVAEPEFLSHSIHRHPEILKQLGLAGRGAIMNGLNLGIIKSLSLPVPPIDVQRTFTERMAKFKKSEESFIESSSKTEDLFHGLAQRAFRGEL